MPDTNREIQELLVDYAETLRDGSIPVFLKSLTHDEAKIIAASREFWDATEVVQTLNGAGFADKAAIPNVGLFISRVDAKIASRLKQAKATPPPPSRGQARTRGSGCKRNTSTKPATKVEKSTEEQI